MSWIIELWNSLGEYYILQSAIKFLWVVVLALGIYFITRIYLLRVLVRLLGRNRRDLQPKIVQTRLVPRLALLVPTLVVFYLADLIPGPSELIRQILSAMMVLFSLLVFSAALNLVNVLYSALPIAKDIPIKSYIEITKLILYILGGLVIISILINKSPLVLLSGVGAVTAILLLVFRETILSFVASIQINTGDLVNVGDWLSVPAFGADGDVLDLALHQVQIQNWDKTITTIPTYKLLDSSFKNWRGMTQSGGRRIKRSLHIDMSSIRFCDADLMNHLSQFRLLREYLEKKEVELQKYHQEHHLDQEAVVNSRRLTNVGTFRYYVEAYLRQHPRIRQDMTLMVRQLKPEDRGLPLEIYCFSNTTDWIEYEQIQADILDHLLAIISEFELTVFQIPAGRDFRQLIHN